MSRWPPILITALSLILLTGCQQGYHTTLQTTATLQAPKEPADQPAEYSTQAPCPELTPCVCPTCQDAVHIVSIYAMREGPEEAATALRSYVIVAQDFRQEHIYLAGSPQGAAIDLLDENVLPVVAWGRQGRSSDGCPISVGPG